MYIMYVRVYVCIYVHKDWDLYEGIISSALCASGKTHCVFMYIMHVCMCSLYLIIGFWGVCVHVCT